MDTRDKRASSIFVGSPWRLTLPVADGALSAADRQHVALIYRGIAAGLGIIAGPDPNETGLEFRRDTKGRLHFRREKGRLHFRREVIR